MHISFQSPFHLVPIFLTDNNGWSEAEKEVLASSPPAPTAASHGDMHVKRVRLAYHNMLGDGLGCISCHKSINSLKLWAYVGPV